MNAKSKHACLVYIEYLRSVMMLWKDDSRIPDSVDPTCSLLPIARTLTWACPVRPSRLFLPVCQDDVVLFKMK